MRELAERVWREPAVFIGLLVSLGLLVVNLIGDPDWSAQAIAAILAPLASSLGIRQLVTPTTEEEEAHETNPRGTHLGHDRDAG